MFTQKVGRSALITTTVAVKTWKPTKSKDVPEMQLKIMKILWKYLHAWSSQQKAAIYLGHRGTPFEGHWPSAAWRLERSLEEGFVKPMRFIVVIMVYVNSKK